MRPPQGQYLEDSFLEATEPHIALPPLNLSFLETTPDIVKGPNEAVVFVDVDEAPTASTLPRHRLRRRRLQFACHVIIRSRLRGSRRQLVVLIGCDGVNNNRHRELKQQAKHR